MSRSRKTQQLSRQKSGQPEIITSKNGHPEIIVSSESVPDFLIKAYQATEKRQIDKAKLLLDDKAIETIRQIIEKNPTRVDIIFVLAKALFEIAYFTDDINLFARSEHWYKELLKKQCPHEMAYNQLGNICQKTGRLGEALKHREKTVALCPDNGQYIAALGTLNAQMGRVKNAISLLRKALEKLDFSPKVHSSLLLDMHYLEELDRQKLFDEHLRWADTYAPLSKAKSQHDNIPDPDRKLRIGYISPDFRLHSVTYFFEPILDGHNRRMFELCGYGSVNQPDKVTERLKAKFDCYRNIYSLDDDTVANIIVRDKIDILVDLAGHTAGCRLGVLASKPAPIQFEYLGYPDTTGLSAVDYRLTDNTVDPPGSKNFYTEQLVYLPDGFLCYKPAEDAPQIAPSPVLANGFITFGSFNNSNKINPALIELWSGVLKANENSHLILKFRGGDDYEMKSHYLKLFERFGIEPERIEMNHVVKTPAQHLKMYSKMDIALDSYPYNGTTTTCEALWMGVPVISLVGDHHASRVGLSILSRIDMKFFAASSKAEYIAKSTALAKNPEALAKIRTTMRNRIMASSLCDAKKFIVHVEAAYRKVWRQWCACQSKK